MITPEEFETAKRLAQEAIGNDPFRVGMAEINCRNSSLRDFMKPQRVLAMLEEIEVLQKKNHLDYEAYRRDRKDKQDAQREKHIIQEEHALYRNMLLEIASECDKNFKRFSGPREHPILGWMCDMELRIRQRVR